METIQLRVDGMSCGSCVASVMRVGGAPRQTGGCCCGH